MIRYILFAITLLFAVFFAGLQPARAYDVFDSSVCSTSEAKKQSAVCNSPNNDPISGDNGLIIKIANIISVIAGGAAVIIIIYGSIKFIVSAGDSAKVKSARDTVLYALIGIAVIVLSRTLVIFVVKKLN